MSASMNIHCVVAAEAKALQHEGTRWVQMEIQDEKGHKFSLSLFASDVDGLLAQIKSTGRDEFTDGVNAAAAMLDKKADDYSDEHGMQDPDTGVMEFGRGAKEDYYNTLRELADEVRDLVHGNVPA